MAGCSKKQYAIMMSAGQEGKKLASEMGGMEQDKFDEAFSALLGSGAYKPQEGEKEYSRDTDEDYGDFDADSDDDYGFDDYRADDYETDDDDDYETDKDYEEGYSTRVSPLSAEVCSILITVHRTGAVCPVGNGPGYGRVNA